MWQEPSPVEDNNCSVCRLRYTKACPAHKDFIGTLIKSKTSYHPSADFKCHRFLITTDEYNKRQKALLKRLQQNLN